MDQTPVPVHNPASRLPLLLGILVFILICVGGFLGFRMRNLKSSVQTVNTVITPSSPAVNSLAGWKIYQNQTLNYVFQYPPSWDAVQNSSTDTNTFFGPNVSDSSGLGGIEVDQSALTPSEYSDYLVQIAVITSILSKTEKTINNNPGIYVQFQGPNPGFSFITKLNGNIYDIYLNSTNQNDKQLYDLLLSTFRFQ
jgi:hypothetical protein